MPMPLQSQYEQEQGGNNWLSRLKNMMSPTSTAGQLGNQDAYMQYVEQSIQAGQQPVSRMQFLQQMQQQGGQGMQGQGRMPSSY